MRCCSLCAVCCVFNVACSGLLLLVVYCLLIAGRGLLLVVAACRLLRFAVRCCLLFVVGDMLITVCLSVARFVRCLLSVVGCLLFVVCCLLFVVWCSLCVVCCLLLFDVCWMLLCVAFGLLFFLRQMLYNPVGEVCCLLLVWLCAVWCLVFAVCLPRV